MAEHGTAIEWTHVPGFKGETWNPVTGCDRVSPGCANCYALELAPKLQRWARGRGGGKWADVVDGGARSGPAFGLTIHPAELSKPVRWRAPRGIFVNSMSDLFHEDVPEAFLAEIFTVMRACPQHIFMVLTKREDVLHDRMRRLSWTPAGRAYFHPEVQGHDVEPLPNLWLGVTIENRRFIHRAHVLVDVPAAVRFISAEPLLGPLVPQIAGTIEDPIAWWAEGDGIPCVPYDGLDLSYGIDWLVVGGESSGPERRRLIGPDLQPIDRKADWVRDLRDMCVTIGVAFFFKQWGGPTPKSGGRELDGRTWSEFPHHDLAVPA